MHNTKEGYPLPGPGAYFNDKATVKKYPEEVRDIITVTNPFLKKEKDRLS